MKQNLTINRKNELEKGLNELGLISNVMIIPNDVNQATQAILFASARKMIGYIAMYESGAISFEVLEHYAKVFESQLDKNIIKGALLDNQRDVDHGVFYIQSTNDSVVSSFLNEKPDVGMLSKFTSVTEFEEVSQEGFEENEELLSQLMNIINLALTPSKLN